jgi:hypothetical protein
MEVNNESGKADFLGYLLNAELSSYGELREQKGLFIKGGGGREILEGIVYMSI